MKKLNGIVLDGKFYEAKKGGDCDKCDLRDEFCKNAWVVLCTKFDASLLDIHFFRLNKEITDKINGNGGRQD